jgi:hypothetical protein
MRRHLLDWFICSLILKAVSNVYDTLYSVEWLDDNNELERIWKEAVVA